MDFDYSECKTEVNPDRFDKVLLARNIWHFEISRASLVGRGKLHRVVVGVASAACLLGLDSAELVVGIAGLSTHSGSATGISSTKSCVQSAS